MLTCYVPCRPKHGPKCRPGHIARRAKILGTSQNISCRARTAHNISCRTVLVSCQKTMPRPSLKWHASPCPSSIYQPRAGGVVLAPSLAGTTHGAVAFFAEVLAPGRPDGRPRLDARTLHSVSLHAGSIHLSDKRGRTRGVSDPEVHNHGIVWMPCQRR